jgi:hypothetical protein
MHEMSTLAILPIFTTSTTFEHDVELILHGTMGGLLMLKCFFRKKEGGSNTL